MGDWTRCELRRGDITALFIMFSYSKLHYNKSSKPRKRSEHGQKRCLQRQADSAGLRNVGGHGI
eukprot:2847474-Amphidinium_carterae.1